MPGRGVLGLGRGVAVLATSLSLYPAAAPATDAQLSVSASTNYTDNTTSAPESGGSETPRESLFLSVVPRLTLLTFTPRLLQLTTLSVDLSTYLVTGQDVAVVATGSHALNYDLSKTLHASVSLVSSYRRAPSLRSEGLVVVPTGPVEFFEVGGSAGLAKDLSPRTRAVEEASATVHLDLADGAAGPRVAIQNRLALQHSLARDAFEGRLGAGANLYLAGDDDGAALDGAHEDYLLSLTGSWARDLGLRWRSTLSGGAALVFSGDSVSVAPLAHLRVDHPRDRVVFFAELSQTVEANTLVGRSFSSSAAGAGLTTTFGPDHKMTASAGAGAAHSRGIGDGAEDSINLARASAGLEWAMVDNLSLGLSYELMYQVAEASTGQQTLLRNTVGLSVNGYWPSSRKPPTPLGLGLRVRETEEEEAEERERTRLWR